MNQDGFANLYDVIAQAEASNGIQELDNTPISPDKQTSQKPLENPILPPI
jgi:hypothetical protein